MGLKVYSFFLNSLKLASIGISLGLQLWIYADKHNLDLYNFSSYVSIFTKQSTDTKVLFTQITGNTLNVVLTVYKMVNKLPDPKVTLIATFASWQAYIVQFSLMTDTLVY